MRLEFLLSTLAVGLSVADQSSYNNGLWKPSPTTEYAQTTSSSYYYAPTTNNNQQQVQSWTTWTSYLVYGTVTVTITSTVPCPTSLTTTTQLVYTTECTPACEPPPVPPTCPECAPVITVTPTTTPTSYWYGYSTTTSSPLTLYTTPGPQPYTTITSGTVVYVVIPSSAAAAGQVTTNGVVQIISAGARNREDADVMKAGLALVVAVLALVVV